MSLTITETTRCEYCHPETCGCPDYVLKLNGVAISAGDRKDLDLIKLTLEQWANDQVEQLIAEIKADYYTDETSTVLINYRKKHEPR